ncbi:MAG: hypothetical protein NTY79_07040 [Chloroflexi bacterium]|nr:hypothetical protein [Chloroflexota bacterium]
MINRPNHAEESSLYLQGYRRIAGFDEAGRGALAGPVVAAAVILPREPHFNWISLVKDSKLLTSKMRERIFGLMRDSASISSTRPKRPCCRPCRRLLIRPITC